MRNPWSLAVSFTTQLTAVGIVLTIPMLKPAAIKWAPPLILYTPPRATPPPVKVEAHGNSQPASSLLRAVFRPALTVPVHVPATISLISADPLPTGISPSIGAAALSALDAGIEMPTLKSPVEVKPPAPKPTVIRASTGVQQALLLRQVKPAYPPLARAARVAGTVRLTALIARDGTIQNLQLLSGPPLLIAAAIDAVRQWRYKPTLLSGEPVEVITEIDVNFTLSN